MKIKISLKNNLNKNVSNLYGRKLIFYRNYFNEQEEKKK